MNGPLNGISVRVKPSESERNKQFSFARTLKHHGVDSLKRNQLLDLQINVGKLCNQACTHCHVDAGPKRTEIMTWETMSKNLRLVTNQSNKVCRYYRWCARVKSNFQAICYCFT